MQQQDLNFLSVSTEKYNVYNIYVAINVPSFFKLNCMCIYFSYWTTMFLFNHHNSFIFIAFFFFSETNRNNKAYSFLLWRRFYSGFRPNECFIVCKSFLRIPVDHCSLYGKYYEYMFLFLIKCDSSIVHLSYFFPLHLDLCFCKNSCHFSLSIKYVSFPLFCFIALLYWEWKSKLIFNMHYSTKVD